MISENIKIVKEKIEEAAKKSGRTPDDITLIAVSKTKPVSDLMEAYNCGSRVFGENKVQEMCQKIEEMPTDIDWHMIGHLQRNKVKYLAGKVALIHSVDSFRLAETIDIESKKHGVITPILIEVNAANEISKFGVSIEDTIGLCKEIQHLDNIKVKGLMTIAPYVVDAEENRIFFHKIRELALDIKTQNIDNIEMNILSMGMTGDYQVAIEEGATMVRVGTGIFGER